MPLWVDLTAFNYSLKYFRKKKKESPHQLPQCWWLQCIADRIDWPSHSILWKTPHRMYGFDHLPTRSCELVLCHFGCSWLFGLMKLFNYLKLFHNKKKKIEIEKPSFHKLNLLWAILHHDEYRDSPCNFLLRTPIWFLLENSKWS